MTIAPHSKPLSHASRLPRVLHVVSLGLLCGLLISGCGEDGPTLNDVKKFDAYPLYYAGDEVVGNKLEDILGEEDWQLNPDQRSVDFTFIYGTCDPAPDGFFDEGGCAPPAQIQVYSICDRHPALYRRGSEVFDLRGAKASANAGGLEIFTGRTTVVIFGDPELFRPTIRRLRRVGQDTPASRLAPPVPGGVRGRLPCQRKLR